MKEHGIAHNIRNRELLHPKDECRREEARPLRMDKFRIGIKAKRNKGTINDEQDAQEHQPT